ncbi:hypothetical protein EV426DRAFT_570293 [Tirmania nivea]|nr:hypothetical protein EV426DRAFT_570293 [Tirmania nivea]
MYLYYLSVITVLLVILSSQVVKTTTTTTTTTITTLTTITTTTTTTRTTILTSITTTTSITTYRGASASQTIDLDAVLQRSIDCQVLAEVKAERVLQYCINQSKYRGQGGTGFAILHQPVQVPGSRRNGFCNIASTSPSTGVKGGTGFAILHQPVQVPGSRRNGFCNIASTSPSTNRPPTRFAANFLHSYTRRKLGGIIIGLTAIWRQLRRLIRYWIQYRIRHVRGGTGIRGGK